MQNNGDEQIHYRLKSKNNNSKKCVGSIPYVLAALSASAITAISIAVCSELCKKSCKFKKHYFTKQCF